MSYTVIFVIAGIVGLILGSFLNVVISRLPIMLIRDYGNDSATPSADEKFNLWIPRSRCEACQHPIANRDLIPIASWLILQGRCRHCEVEISWRYPCVEMLTCFLAVLVVGISGGFNLWSLALALLTGLLLCQAIIDYERKVLVDELSYLILWIGLLSSVVFSASQLLPQTEDAVIGAVFGYLSFWLINHGFRAGFKKDGMGAGDFKLFAGIGAWVGWVFLPVVVLIAITFAFVYAFTQVIRRKYSRTEGIPFGPFLAVAGFIAVLFREELSYFMMNFNLL